jgi:hypothetical protein
MTSVVAIGVGIAAAAFLVSNSELGNISQLTKTLRVGQDFWQCGDIGEEPLEHWAKRITKVVLSQR